MFGQIRTLIMMFLTAFEQFQVEVPPLEVESLAVLVHRGMTAKGRRFHTPEHILSLADPNQPIFTLAALFHDLVYYQVDLGFAPVIRTLLEPYVCEKDQRLWIKLEIPEQDPRPFNMLLELFDYQRGMELRPQRGMNEFLSALVMVLRLRPYISCELLLAIATCIEATIPFRPQTHFEELEQRLHQIAARYQLNLTADAIERMVMRSVEFANRDVENFAFPDPRHFLENTWNLLPEAHRALREGGIYTIRDYRHALQATAEFFQNLDVNVIFHRYRDNPPLEQWERMVHQAQVNIQIAQSYLEIKLLTICVLEALADVSGGDMPLALIMGNFDERGQSLIDFIEFPDLQVQWTPVYEQDAMVFKLLTNGRTGASDFDTQRSPLALFLYRILGPDGTHVLSKEAWGYMRGHLTAEEFLSRLPRNILAPIARACALMIPTRRESCLRYA